MAETTTVEAFIAEWRDTGGSELANTQSFINGLCAILDVLPPKGSPRDVARIFDGKRASSIEPVLKALTAIGQARQLADGRYAA
jgi:hypothetical protein